MDSDAEWKKQVRKTLAKIAKYSFWILGLGGLCFACYVLYNTLARPVAAILIFLGGILSLYFYYVKWFVIPASRPAWPPYQTLCPDYLTPISPGYTTGSDGSLAPKSGGVIKCVDFVGVSKNGNLKKTEPENLSNSLNDPTYYVTIDPKSSQDDLKAMLQTYGLTWVSMFGDNI